MFPVQMRGVGIEIPAGDLLQEKAERVDQNRQKEGMAHKGKLYSRRASLSTVILQRPGWLTRSP